MDDEPFLIPPKDDGIKPFSDLQSDSCAVDLIVLYARCEPIIYLENTARTSHATKMRCRYGLSSSERGI